MTLEHHDDCEGDCDALENEPKCVEAKHKWTFEGEGGCDENPGVWSMGGTMLVFYSRCLFCGITREEVMYGSQRDPYQCDTISYGYDEDDD
jgi:hypothetical protein